VTHLPTFRGRSVLRSGCHASTIRNLAQSPIFAEYLSILSVPAPTPSGFTSAPIGGIMGAAISMHAAPDQVSDSLPGSISIPVLSRNSNQALLHRPTLGEIVGWIDIEPRWEIADAAS
jgi:hypothetical protein